MAQKPIAFVFDEKGNAWNMFKFAGGFSLRCSGVDVIHRYSGDLIIIQSDNGSPILHSNILVNIDDKKIRFEMGPGSMLFLEMYASNWKDFAYWLSKRTIEIDIVGNPDDPTTIPGLVLFIVDGEHECNIYLNDFWIGFLSKFAINPERLNEAR